MDNPERCFIACKFKHLNVVYRITSQKTYSVVHRIVNSKQSVN